ncbi:MAG: small multi-drug export protein [Parcubacteria group bacterium]|nr:small multi-drug export protein [Parcubacteria group bacterium]
MNQFSHWLTVIGTALLPIAELRGAIPLGIGKFGLPTIMVFFVSVIANIVGAVLAFLLMGRGSKFLSTHSPLFARFFQWLFGRTRRVHGAFMERISFWGLVVFIAIPLPLTGGYTGAVVAFLTGMRPRKAIAAIALGVLLAGIIVTFATIGVGSLF